METTMGLTPLGGVPMGSRSGDLDPSVITYLMRKLKNQGEKAIVEIENILNKKSGIYGVSRISKDFRDVEFDAISGGHHARLALDIFDYRVAQEIAKCMVAIGGADVITFEGGVGEKGPLDRKHICRHLKFFGVELDELANEIKGEEKEISKKDSPIKVFVIPTNEEYMIARKTYELVK